MCAKLPVSVGFASKERPRKVCLRGKWGESQKKKERKIGVGEGKEENACRQTWIFKTQFASERCS